MYTESFLPAVRLSNKLYCVLTCCILVLVHHSTHGCMYTSYLSDNRELFQKSKSPYKFLLFPYGNWWFRHLHRFCNLIWSIHRIGKPLARISHADKKAHLQAGEAEIPPTSERAWGPWGTVSKIGIFHGFFLWIFHGIVI